MINLKTYKRIAIALIVVAVLLIPTLFTVSYAKWTGGGNGINATVNVVIGGGSTSDGPFKPSQFPEGFTGGMLIRGADGTPVTPDVYVDYSGTTIGFKWDFLQDSGAGRIDNFEGELYVQFFMKTDNPNDPDATAFTVENPDKGMAGQPDTITIYVKAVNLELHEQCNVNNCGVTHESGSYWYKISRKGYYNVNLENSWTDGSPRLLIQVS